MTIFLDLSSRQHLEVQCKRYAGYVSSPRASVVTANVLCDVLMFMGESDSNVTPNLVRDGFWEAWITLAIARAVKPGMNCVDVGANCGYYSALFAKMGAGRVLAIEPNAILAELMRTTFRVNDMKNVEVLAVAAGSEAHSDTLVVPECNWGVSGLQSSKALMTRLADFIPARNVSMTNVLVFPFDTLLASWDRVDFIKVDVEGSEYEVWQGMQETLAKNPQAIVVMEVGVMPGSRDYKWADFEAEIMGTGWKVQTIDASGDVVDGVKVLDTNTKDSWGMVWLTKDE